MYTCLSTEWKFKKNAESYFLSERTYFQATSEVMVFQTFPLRSIVCHYSGWHDSRPRLIPLSWCSFVSWIDVTNCCKISGAFAAILHDELIERNNRKLKLSLFFILFLNKNWKSFCFQFFAWNMCWLKTNVILKCNLLAQTKCDFKAPAEIDSRVQVL